jgi:hypothetical protein
MALLGFHGRLLNPAVPQFLAIVLTLEHFYFYCTTYPELLKQFRQSLAVTLPIDLDIAL